MIYIYARVSSDIQGKDGVSLDQQEESMVKWAKSLNEDFEVYREVKSGRTIEKRPIFQGILSTMEEGDTLMVYDQTRLGRDSRNDLEVAETLTKKGVKLFIDGRYIDLTNPNDYFLFTMNSGFSTLQTRMQSKKSTEAIKRVRENGDWIFDGRTFGYIVVKSRGRTFVQIDEQSANYIRYIFTEVAEGRPIGNIVAELYGTVCPNFPKWKFEDTSVREMLRRPLYMGYYFKTPNRKRNVLGMSKSEIESDLVKANNYTPIVSEELWWKAWKNWNNVHRVTMYRDSTKSEIGGIIKCGCCGCHSDKNYRKMKKDGTRGIEFRVTRHYNWCEDKIFKGYEEKQYTWILRLTYFLTFLGGYEVGAFIEDKKACATLDVDSLKREIELLKKEYKDCDFKISNLMTSVAEGNSYSNIRSFVTELEDKKKRIVNQIKGIEESIADKREYIDELLEMSSENKIEEMIHGTKRRKLYQELLEAKQFKGYLEVTYLNGKKFIISDNQKHSRKATPQRFSVSFRGEEQFTGTLNYLDNTFSFDRVEETDTFSKAVNDYRRELEEKVLGFLKEMED